MAARYSGNPVPGQQWAETMRNERMAGWVGRMERQNGPFPAGMRARMLANDPDALAACTIAIGDAPDFADDLADLRVPMLIYAGDRDQPTHDLAARAVPGRARVRFVTLPGLNHREGIMRSDVVLPHIRVFLAALDDATPAHA